MRVGDFGVLVCVLVSDLFMYFYAILLSLFEFGDFVLENLDFCFLRFHRVL